LIDYVYTITDPPEKFAIPEGGFYYFYLANCSRPVRIQEISIAIHNNWGWLRWSHFPILIFGWIEVGAYLVLLILVLVNSFRNAKLRFFFHKFIIGVLIARIVTAVVNGVLYVLANRSLENGNFVNVTSSVLVGIQMFILIMLSLFIATGMSTVYERIPRCDVAKMIVFSTIVAAFVSLCDTGIGTDFIWALLTIAAFIIVFLVYWFLIESFSAKAISVLQAHLLMILAIHIDPTTTPSERKRQLLLTTKKADHHLVHISGSLARLFCKNQRYRRNHGRLCRFLAPSTTLIKKPRDKFITVL
jgi:hypothetical protein